MKRFFVILVFLSLLLPACVDRQKRNMELTNGGRAALYAGQLDEAGEALHKALEYDSTNAETYLLLSQLYVSQKDFKQALNILDISIKYRPDYGETYKALALIYHITGDRERACKNFKKARELGVPNLDNYLKMCR